MPALRDRLVRLIDESKRRGVLRVAAVYLVGAWLAIQVSDVTFPRLGLPDSSVTFVIVLLAVLFPVVVGLSWMFDLTRTGPRRVTDPEPAARDVLATADGNDEPVPARVRARVPVTLAALCAFPLVAFGLWWANDAGASGLDPQLVAITPFRVAGASADVRYLREGLMDLVAARIGGDEGGLRVVPPRTMSRRLREELGSLEADPEIEQSLDLAAELGAGRLLEGVVVGDGRRLLVSAKLYDVADGRVLADPAPIEVHPDSLHDLVDMLATRLIASEAGLRPDRLAALTTTSLPALRAYLEGESAFRRGQHSRAITAYEQAVTLDTTFAAAALGLMRSRGWALAVPSEIDWDRAGQIVHAGVDRLSEADRAFWTVMSGGVYAPSTLADGLRRKLAAAERMPDEPEMIYVTGDHLVHFGTALGIDDAMEQGRRYLERVVEMDSTYAEPLIHLFEIAVSREDTAAIDRYGDLLLALDSAGPFATKVRYARQLLGIADPDAPPIVLDSLDDYSLGLLTHIGWAMPPEPEVADVVVRRFQEATLPRQRAAYAQRVESLAMRAGRTSLLEEVYDAWEDEPFVDVDRMTTALYGERDLAKAVRLADDVRHALSEARSQTPAGTASIMVTGRECMLAQVAIAAQDYPAAGALLQSIENAPAHPNPFDTEFDRVCTRYLATALAVHQQRPDALRRLDDLDETLRSGPDIPEFILTMYNLGLVALWEQAGQPERALAVARRRMYTPGGALLSNELLLERARLAERTGRRDEAIRAYRDYLTYFHAPEPPFDERVRQARERLAALAGESRR